MIWNLPFMPRSMLEALALRSVPGEGPVDIRRLATGLVNESYRVTRGGRAFALRIAAAQGADLGPDRAWECRVLDEAARHQLAPAVRTCDPASGIVVADWMDGRAWTREETLQPAAVDAIACLLRRVHALPIPTPTRALGPADWIALYSCALARRGVPVRERAALSGAVEEQLAVLRSAAPATPVMCHSDLHCQNLLVGTPASLAPAGAAVAVAVGGAAAVGGASVSGPLVLLDWEYAHVSDPLWDVAGWACNNDWSFERTEALLSSYLGRMPRAAETRRLRALAWLYDYVCLLWSELYVNLRDGAENGGVSQRAGEISHRLRQLR